MKTRDFLSTSIKGGTVIAIAIIIKVIVGAGTQVVLARILAPEMFGQIAFASVVAMFFNAFTDLRGDAYVIHQKDSPQNAIDVVFTLELIAATFFVTLIFLLAPSIMNALGKSDLTIYVQLLALSFFYNPFVLPRSFIERNLFFVRSKLSEVISQLTSAVISIALALWGYGIWSIIWWRLSVLLVDVIILWATSPYKPRLRWDLTLIRRCICFSWPLACSGILVFFYYNIDYFIIGQFLKDGAKQLGYYWLGFQVASYLLMARQVLYGVLFPIFSRLDNEELKKQAFLRLSGATASIFLTLTIIAVSFGRDVISFVYGSQWGPGVFPFQIIFIVVLMRAINSNTGYYFHSCGKTLPDFEGALMFSILLPPAAYFGTISYGINGTALAVLAVQVIVNIVIYERHVRPMTGHGVFYFFFWPWMISGLALALALISYYFTLSLFTRGLFFVLLICVNYFFVFRSVLRDVKAVLRILKPMQPGEAAA